MMEFCYQKKIRLRAKHYSSTSSSFLVNAFVFRFHIIPNHFVIVFKLNVIFPFFERLCRNNSSPEDQHSILIPLYATFDALTVQARTIQHQTPPTAPKIRLLTKHHDHNLENQSWSSVILSDGGRGFVHEQAC